MVFCICAGRFKWTHKKFKTCLTPRKDSVIIRLLVAEATKGVAVVKPSSPIHLKQTLKINQKLLDGVRKVVHNLASVLNEVSAK